MRLPSTLASSAHHRTEKGVAKKFVEMVQLSTSDNEVFNVDRDVAERSMLIKTMLDDLGDEDAPIPLVNVSSNVLKKVSTGNNGSWEERIELNSRITLGARILFASSRRSPCACRRRRRFAQTHD
jgi:hypothetical protein